MVSTSSGLVNTAYNTYLSGNLIMGNQHSGDREEVAFEYPFYLQDHPGRRKINVALYKHQETTGARDASYLSLA
jgi:hypothetical protein